MSGNRTDEDLARAIIQTARERKPETVQELVNLIKDGTTVPEKKIVESILKLQDEGKLKLMTPTQPSATIGAYLKTTQALWYWVTVALAVLAVAAVFTIPEDFYPWIYIRYVLGAIFVLWLPGYSLIKALFPKTPPTKTSDKNLDTIERVALGFGMSLALVPIIALMLNYTPWGIRLTPITLSLTALTLTLSTAAIVREWQGEKPDSAY